MAKAWQEVSPVMLRGAKHLKGQRDRPFAAAQGDNRGKSLVAQRDRPFAAAQGDTRGKRQAGECCHAEGSERSVLSISESRYSEALLGGRDSIGGKVARKSFVKRSVYSSSRKFTRSEF